MSVFKINIGKTSNGNRYINWMSGDWLEKFIEYQFPDKKQKITYISVDGRRPCLDNDNNKKIFFSGENLEPNISHKNIRNDYLNIRYYWFNIRKNLYKDYLLDEADLSLGYANKNFDNYLRFPLWIMYLFDPRSKYSDIQAKVLEINKSRNLALKDFICINRHDLFGLRTKICNDLGNKFTITYAGKWRNNTNELWENYDNDKLRYLNLFKFNICPENMDAPYYCTEKLFDSLRCGCIPIYAGCLNNPEPEIINKNFVIFWDLDGDNSEQIKLVSRLSKDENYYQKFVTQPKLKAVAVDYIAEYFEQLKTKLKDLI